jgi:hypothetical protein
VLSVFVEVTQRHFRAGRDFSTGDGGGIRPDESVSLPAEFLTAKDLWVSSTDLTVPEGDPVRLDPVWRRLIESNAVRTMPKHSDRA